MLPHRRKACRLPGGNRCTGTAHFDVYRLCLLGLQRQDQPGGGLSLMAIQPEAESCGSWDLAGKRRLAGSRLPDPARAQKICG